MASIFSGKAGRNAAIWTANYLKDEQKNIDSMLDSGLASSTNAIRYGTQNSLAALGGADSTLRSGEDSARNYLNAAYTDYWPVYAPALAGYNAYADATGANGADGQARALSNFRADPGYRFAVDEAVDANDRRAAQRGMLASGNTIDATTRLASNLADQQYGQYVNRLSPYLSLAPQIQSQRAGIYGGLANLATQTAGARAGLDTQRANLFANEGQGLASLYDQDAARRANVVMDIARQIVPAGQQGMMAGQNAAANRFGALMGGANLLAQGLGGLWGTAMPGGGSFGGKILSGLF